MSFMRDVLVNVAAAIVVLGIAALAGWLTLGNLRRAWRTLKFAVRMSRNGILNFISNRQEFSTLSAGKSLAEYIELTQREMIYIGFYLAGATDRSRVDDSLRALLKKGCHVQLIFLSDDVAPELLKATEETLGIASGTLAGALKHAFSHFDTFSRSLSLDDLSRFSVRRHSAMLASSAFLIDYDSADGRILVNTKIHGAGRDASYAIEFSSAAARPSLAWEYGSSFKRIALGSTPVNTGD